MWCSRSVAGDFLAACAELRAAAVEGPPRPLRGGDDWTRLPPRRALARRLEADVLSRPVPSAGPFKFPMPTGAPRQPGAFGRRAGCGVHARQGARLGPRASAGGARRAAGPGAAVDGRRAPPRRGPRAAQHRPPLGRGDLLDAAVLGLLPVEVADSRSSLGDGPLDVGFPERLGHLVGDLGAARSATLSRCRPSLPCR